VELGAILGMSWASGLNLYLSVSLLGLAGRLGWADTPEALQEPWVMATALGMFCVEFVVDKIPWLDSAWDAVHTVIRPAGAAVVAGLIAGTVGDVPSGVAAAVGGALGLSSHAAKASTRLVANASPEPFSNVALSVGEDSLVVGMAALAIAYPWVAGGAALVLAVLCVVVVVVMLGAVKAALRRMRERRSLHRGTGRFSPPS
jgi:hypothetical protein